VRLADTDASIIAFYRGLFMGLIMLCVWLISGFILMFLMFFLADHPFDIGQKSLFWLVLMGFMQVISMFPI